MEGWPRLVKRAGDPGIQETWSPKRSPRGPVPGHSGRRHGRRAGAESCSGRRARLASACDTPARAAAQVPAGRGPGAAGGRDGHAGVSERNGADPRGGQDGGRTDRGACRRPRALRGRACSRPAPARRAKAPPGRRPAGGAAGRERRPGRRDRGRAGAGCGSSTGRFGPRDASAQRRSEGRGEPGWAAGSADRDGLTRHEGAAAAAQPGRREGGRRGATGASGRAAWPQTP